MEEEERDEILYRLDERTKRLDSHLDRIDSRLESVEDQTDQNRKRIRDTENDIEEYDKVAKYVGAATLAIVSGIGAEVFGLLP